MDVSGMMGLLCTRPPFFEMAPIFSENRKSRIACRGTLWTAGAVEY